MRIFYNVLHVINQINTVIDNLKYLRKNLLNQGLFLCGLTNKHDNWILAKSLLMMIAYCDQVIIVYMCVWYIEL